MKVVIIIGPWRQRWGSTLTNREGHVCAFIKRGHAQRHWDGPDKALRTFEGSNLERFVVCVTAG